MIADAALRKVIGAYALGPVARADEPFPFGRARAFASLAFGFKKPRFEDFHRLRLILVLRFFLLHGDDDACWKMRDPNRGFRLVDMLSARPAGAVHINP